MPLLSQMGWVRESAIHTQQEEEILPFDPLAETHKRLAEVQAKLDENIIDTDFRILMLESLSASNM